ncbi:guanyl-specific ribonuclease N1 [Podospora australis]|uniref:Guanyl-specific ribonuclease N1 n=1 Tax=Podospora australis TaxID=1536484 RepID=A0AAN7AP00_9PEZI|nr:guanyl-specific ribonuclease N1 [Podospora australis]
MLSLKSLLAIAVYGALSVAAQGTASIGTVVCGSNTYTKKQIEEATAEGCRLQGSPIGTNNYPHRFNNREGLILATSGPFQEFPIVRNGNYTGGNPGADRIIFNPNVKGVCTYIDAMTHTEAPTRNGFVLCTTRTEGRPGNSPSSSSSVIPTSSSTSSSTATGTSSTASPSSSSSAQKIGAQGAALALMAWAFVL